MPNVGDTGDSGLIPESEATLEGNGNPLQYFCLGNPMDKAARRATDHGVTKSLDTAEDTCMRS